MHKSLLGLEFAAKRTSGAPATDSAAGEKAAPERHVASNEQVTTQGGAPVAPASAVRLSPQPSIHQAALEAATASRNGVGESREGDGRHSEGQGAMPEPRPLTTDNPSSVAPDLQPPSLRSLWSSGSSYPTAPAALPPPAPPQSSGGVPPSDPTATAGRRVKAAAAHHRATGPMASDAPVGPSGGELPLGSHPHRPRDGRTAEDGGAEGHDEAAEEPGAAGEGPYSALEPSAPGAEPAGGHYLRTSNWAIFGLEALQMAFPDAVSAARRTGARQPVQLHFELAGGGPPVPYELPLNNYGGRMSLVYTADAHRALGLRSGDKLRVPVPEPGGPVRAVQVVSSGEADAEEVSELSPPPAEEPEVVAAPVAPGVPDTLLAAAVPPPPEQPSDPDRPDGVSEVGLAVGRRTRGRVGDHRALGPGCNGGGGGGGVGSGRGKAVGDSGVETDEADVGRAEEAGECAGEVDRAVGADGEAVAVASGAGDDMQVDASAEGGDGGLQGRGPSTGRGRGRGRGRSRGRGRASGGFRRAADAAPGGGTEGSSAGGGDGVAADVDLDLDPAMKVDLAAPTSPGGDDHSGGGGGGARGVRGRELEKLPTVVNSIIFGGGRGRGRGRGGRAGGGRAGGSPAAGVDSAVASAETAAADAGGVSEHAAARPTRRRVNKLEVAMADLVRPKEVAVDDLLKAAVDFEWLPPYSSDLGSEHKARFHEITQLLRDTFPKNAQQIKQSVRRDCSGGVRNETCMVAGLWVGEQLGCASLVRVNEDSHGQYQHVQILYHATTEDLRRRSLGRLLVCCILRGVLEAGLEYATVVIGRGEGAKAFWTSIGFRPPIAADGHAAKRVAICSQEQAPRDEIWLAPLMGEMPVAELPGGTLISGTAGNVSGTATPATEAAAAAGGVPLAEVSSRKRRRLTDGLAAGRGGSGGGEGMSAQGPAHAHAQEQAKLRLQNALVEANRRVDAAAALVRLRLEAAPRQFVPVAPPASRAPQSFNSTRERKRRLRAAAAAAAAGCSSPDAAAGAAGWIQLLAAMRRRARRLSRAADSGRRAAAAATAAAAPQYSGGGAGAGTGEFEPGDLRAGAACYFVRVSHQGSELVLGVRTCREAFPRLMAAAISERTRQPIRLAARLADGTIREYDGFLAATSSNNYYFNGVGGMLRDLGTRSGWVRMWVRQDGGVIVDQAEAGPPTPPPKSPAVAATAAASGGGAAAAAAAPPAPPVPAASRPGFHPVQLRSSSLLGTTITVPQAVVKGLGLGGSAAAPTESESEHQQPQQQPQQQAEQAAEEDLTVPVRVHFWRGVYRASDAVLQRMGSVTGGSGSIWKLCGLQPWLRYRGAAPGDFLLIGVAPAPAPTGTAGSGAAAAAAAGVEILVELSKGGAGLSGVAPAPPMVMAAASAGRVGGGGGGGSAAAAAAAAPTAGFARKRPRTECLEAATAPPAVRARYTGPELKLEVEETEADGGLGFLIRPHIPPNRLGPPCSFVLQQSHFTSTHITYIPVNVMANLFAPLTRPQPPQQPAGSHVAGPAPASESAGRGQQQQQSHHHHHHHHHQSCTEDGGEEQVWPQLTRLPQTIPVWTETPAGELDFSPANFHYYSSCSAWRVRRLVPWLVAEGAQPGWELVLRLATWGQEARAAADWGPSAGSGPQLAIVASLERGAADQDMDSAENDGAAVDGLGSGPAGSYTFPRPSQGRGRGRGRGGQGAVGGAVGGFLPSGGRGRGRGQGRRGTPTGGVEHRPAGLKRKLLGDELEDGEWQRLASGPLPAEVLLTAVRAELPLPPPPPPLPPSLVQPSEPTAAAAAGADGADTDVGPGAAASVAAGSLAGLAEAVRERLRQIRPSVEDPGPGFEGPAGEEWLPRAVSRLDNLGAAAVVAASSWVAGGQLAGSGIDGALLRVACAPLAGLKVRLAVRHRPVGGDAGVAPPPRLTWGDVAATATFGELLDSLATAEQAGLVRMAAWLRSLAAESGSEGVGVTLQLEPRREPGAVAGDAAAAAAGVGGGGSAQAPRLRVKLAGVAREWHQLATRPLAQLPPRSSPTPLPEPILKRLLEVARQGNANQHRAPQPQPLPRPQLEAQPLTRPVAPPAGPAPSLPSYRHAGVPPAGGVGRSSGNPAVLSSSTPFVKQEQYP